MSDQQRDAVFLPSADRTMPAHRVIHAFLPQDMVEGLIEHARANQSRFEPTGVANGVNLVFRISSATRFLGGFRPLLGQRILDIVPRLTAELQMKQFAPHRIELELVAHNDGAFYTRHIDTLTLQAGAGFTRALSGVYYFHRAPKAFTGGALRLYPVSRYAVGRSADIQPEHNTLLLFPSVAPHEVLPVQCPSGEFMDSRFAINCWVHTLRPHGQNGADMPTL